MLPPPSSKKQSWIDYLTDLSEDQALLATAIAMKTITLDSMVKSRETFEKLVKTSNATYVMVCESEFDDAPYRECRKLWTTLLRTAFAADAGMAEELGEHAATTCPNSKDAPAAAHSNAANEETAARRVVQLRKLDHKYLDGWLHKIEASVPCQVSRRYGGESAAGKGQRYQRNMSDNGERSMKRSLQHWGVFNDVDSKGSD